MKPSAPRGAAPERKVAKRALGIGTALVLLLGIAWADAPTDIAAYLLVVAASILPAFVWVLKGRPGVPVLPATAALCILYYAIPIVRGREDLSEYARGDILRAACTVALYLALATLVSLPFLRAGRFRGNRQASLMSDSQMKNVVFMGLGLGVFFLGATYAGLLWWLGSFFGLARTVALTALIVACYFLGVARGRGLLHGRDWLVGGGGLALAVLISWGTLFLIGGLIFLLAAGVGYVTTRGRIPWLLVASAVVLVSILHAGKEEMRNRYWQGSSGAGENVGLSQLPGRLVEWFELGVESYGSRARSRSALDRASLLHILLRVQRLTPAFIDYLRGDTYKMLPETLMPRFLNPDKPKSQVGMDLLNVRYGVLTLEGTEKTAVGWGLIAEAYANFGVAGVGGMAILVGLVSGALTKWSSRSSTVSVSTLLAVAFMVGLVNLEQDFVALVTSLMQSVAAVFVFVALLRLFPRSPVSAIATASRRGHLAPTAARLRLTKDL